MKEQFVRTKQTAASWFVLFLLFASGAIAAEPTPAASADALALSLPDLSWAVEIAAPGFKLEDQGIAPGGRATRLQAVNKKSGIRLSAFLEPAAGSGGAKECREHYWNRGKNSPFTKEQIRIYESEPFAIVDYIMTGLGRVRHVNAYLAEGRYWIDIHISQAEDKVPEGQPFLSILKAVRINRSYTPSARDCFRFGNAHFERNDYQRAALQFEKALAQDKPASPLGRDAWKQLVVRLGMSYGIAGDLEKAKKVLQSGIAREPEYPLFYYNLACAFAEQGNRQQALDNLRLAYKHKDHALAEQRVPDPKGDSSFERFRNDRKFWEELDKVK
jgi:tetratricopeptide (TPR) repeat protein